MKTEERIHTTRTERYHPIKELLLARIREFVREPTVIFWVYGFPLLLAIGLGIAFRNRPMDQIFVDVQEHSSAAKVVRDLRNCDEFVVEIHSAGDCRNRLRLGKSSIVVVPEAGAHGNSFAVVSDPTRPESALARQMVEDVLQKAAGREDVVVIRDEWMTEPGARYIDFLVPGLLGMNLMAAGLWGMGFNLVDMRVKKLLKMFVSSPMKKTDFLFSMIVSRLIFMVPEVLIILGGGNLLFGVPVRGAWATIFLVSLLGSFCFAGLGLLIASRAQRLETVSGLMNLIQLPMWILSGIFFSPDRFPDIVQPLVQALPLTQLNYCLRAVVLEGAPLASLWWELALLVVWAAVCFLCALKWFRWN